MIFYQSDELKEEKGADGETKKERTRGFLLESSHRGRLPAPSRVADHRRGGA